MTAEQYQLDQLDKCAKSDPVEQFPKQYEQQHNKTSAYQEQLYDSSNRNTTQNKQKERTHINIRRPQGERLQKYNINTNQKDRNNNDSNGMKTWYGRLIKKPDRLTYN